MSRYIIPLVMACGLGVLATGCGNTAKDRENPLVAVSIPPIASIVKAVAGSGVEVMTVAEKSADPETFEPTVSQMMKIADADVLFTVGTLPFEKSLSENLRSDGRGVKVADVASDIEKIHGTHSHRHRDGSVVTHDDVDPHVWSSLRCMEEMTRSVCATLSEFYPDSADCFKRRADIFVSRLDSANKLLTAKFAADTLDRVFMIWHPSLSYFARDYSLKQIAVGAEHKENTPARIRSAMEAARESGVRVMFLQKNMDPRMAESITGTASLRVCTFDPMEEDMINELIKVADEITMH